MKDITKNTIEIFDQLAEEYERQFLNEDRYYDTLDAFCDAIQKKNAKILEAGCGPANITNYLTEKSPD